MKMIEVESSVIDSVGYDHDSGTLMIVFRDGHVHELYLVPRHVYEELLEADSKGSFFNEKLKFGNYGQRRTRRA